ncbi:hypothetical protein Hdeb2414_s0010g00336041 [Helianthus debilis subsp. tardiflorus]
MGFRRKRKKLKEFSGDMKCKHIASSSYLTYHINHIFHVIFLINCVFFFSVSNHDVFLSFKDKIRSGCENRQNYSVGIKCFPILRSRICIWVWAHWSFKGHNSGTCL